MEKIGWTGTPYESVYKSRWGDITPDQILFVDPAVEADEAIATARAGGYRFVRWRYSNKWETDFYKLRGTVLASIEAEKVYRVRATERARTRYNSDPRARCKQILCELRSRAKRLGRSYDLNTENLLTRMIDIGVCEQTGIPFDLDRVGTAFAPSVDRIDSKGGYTMDNVQVVCRIFNTMKLHYEDGDLNRFIDALAASRGFTKLAPPSEPMVRP